MKLTGSIFFETLLQSDTRTHTHTHMQSNKPRLAKLERGLMKVASSRASWTVYVVPGM